jgi:hypothetical protein
MAKKCLLILILTATFAGGVFAQSEFRLGAGAGGYFTSDFGGGVEWSIYGQPTYMRTPYTGGGGFVFFDAIYAELSLGFFTGNGTVGSGENNERLYTGLDIGLFGKYPFELNEMLSIFPLLGVTYRAMLSAKTADGSEIKEDGNGLAGDFSALWFKLGCGADFFFTDNIHLRGEVSYGLRLTNKFENDYITQFFETEYPKTLIGHGFEAKVAAGYRF